MEYKIELAEDRLAPEPYKGTRRVHTLVIKSRMPHEDEFTPCDERLALQLANQIVRGIPATGKFLKDKDDPERDWHETYVEYTKVLEPGVIQMKTVTPYTD